MDKKVLLQALLWSFAAYLLFQLIVFQVYGPSQPRSGSPTSQPATGPAIAGDAAPQSPPVGEEQPRPVTDAGGGPAGALSATGASESTTFALGSVDGGTQSPFRAELTLSNVGASIESVRLSDFKASVDGEPRYELVRPVPAEGSELRSLALERLLVDGEPCSLADVAWRGSTAESGGSQSVIFECDIDRDGAPLLRLTHRYLLKPSPVADRRFDLETELRVQNLSGAPHEVRISQFGPVGLQREEQRVDDRGVNVGIHREGQVEDQVARLFGDISGNTQAVKLYSAADESGADRGRFWWVATENKYFAFVTAPLKSDGFEGSEGPDYVFEASAADLDGDAASPDDVVLKLVLGSLRLGPNESTNLRMVHYLGPRDKRVFQHKNNSDYLRRNYAMLTRDRPSMCTFGWLTELMITLLNLFHSLIGNYGVAIFLLVLVVRTILHPITKKTQINMVKMQQSMSKLQPKLEEVKKRFANDKARLQQETMKVYKDAGVNPAGSMLSCLPMMLQMPIWVALYTSLNNNIAMRHQGFMLWINDLTAPDELYKFGDGFSLPLIGTIAALNLLPLLVGITMYTQQKLMPKPKPPPGQSDQAAQMQKQMQAMMPIMSVFMVFIFYNMPSGLNLYIMTSSVLGAIEQWRIRKHVEQAKEDAAQAAPPARPRPSGPRPPSFLERLAKKADEAQKLRRKER